MAQQFKDKDTKETLIGAFRTLANGKDAIGADALENELKPEETAFLLERMSANQIAAGGYDYVPFSLAVYNASEL